MLAQLKVACSAMFGYTYSLEGDLFFLIYMVVMNCDAF